MNNIIRVFPRKTKATPDDELVRFDEPGFFEPDNLSEIHISVAFTYDLKKSEELYFAWNQVYPGLVKMGGPALNERGGDFVPGMYLKKSYVITSRGCPNKCWFCSVWRREGSEVRELPICEGYNILDDNLLACSDQHIKAVFNMLSRQKEPADFTGGFEAKRLKAWHCEELSKTKVKQIFFAYDTQDDYEPLVEAGKLLNQYNFNLRNRKLRAYVLIGYPLDSFEAAEKRLYQTLEAGFLPHAMLWKNDRGETDQQWKQFQRLWARPAIIMSRIKGTIYN